MKSSEAASGCVLQEKVFLGTSQNSQENTCAKAPFLIKKRLWHKCFLVNLAKFLRTPFLQNTRKISKNTFLTEHLWATVSES